MEASELKNPNHPKKGAEIRVDPIKDLKAISTIKKLLKGNKQRDYCLFILGINTNLRASDMLRIGVGQVRELSAGDTLTIKEKKTGKIRMVTVNKSVAEAIQYYLGTVPELEDKSALFSGQRGRLTVPSVNRLVKGWCRDINLKGNFGSHTLRKTFGYHQRIQLNTSIAELMVMFNHNSQRQTLDYLCIQPDEIKDAYMKLCL